MGIFEGKWESLPGAVRTVLVLELGKQPKEVERKMENMVVHLMVTPTVTPHTAKVHPTIPPVMIQAVRRKAENRQKRRKDMDSVA